jgi:glycosyltransferase involved in cell wall biosynthesis
LHHEKTLKFDRMPLKKILIGCFSVPGMGGANTAAYKLFEFMQGDGREVAYMNIIDEQDSDYYHYVFGEYWGNPKRLPQVYNCVLSRPPFVLDARHKEVVNLVEQWRPDLLIGIDFNATLLLRAAAPRMPLVFLTTGCDEIKTLLPRQDALRLIKSGVGSDGRLGAPLLKHEREQEAVAAADLIVTNAEVVKKLYEYFYPAHTGKILSDVIWFAEWVYQDALEYSRLRKPFTTRKIDVLFVANRWSRPEKNFSLVEKLVKETTGWKIHVVGEVEYQPGRAIYHGLIHERDKLFGLMGNAKTVACSSLFDSAPGVLFEASAMGCNVVASKHCGNWELCHPRLLVEPLDYRHFREAISLSLSARFEDNINLFLSFRSYRNLLDTIDVF